MFNANIKYIIFDLNGTLIDAISTYIKVFTDVLEERTGIRSPEIAKYSARAAGTSWDEQFAFILEKNNLSKDKVPEMTEEFFRRVDLEKYSLYPEAKETLKYFKDKNCKIFISSASKAGPMIKRIYEMGILPHVDFLVGSDIYKKGPAHIKLLSDKEELVSKDFAKQAIYFGDGPGDMRIAKSCGLYAVGVAQTVDAELLKQAGANLVIEKIGDAMEIELGKITK
jgi:phosphoglycolate phosphatase